MWFSRKALNIALVEHMSNEDDLRKMENKNDMYTSNLNETVEINRTHTEERIAGKCDTHRD